MAKKISVSLDEGTLTHAREAAQREGLALSTWLDRAARRQYMRENLRRQQEWLEANPEAQEDAAAWEADFGPAAQWADLDSAA